MSKGSETSIRLLINGTVITVDDVEPTQTLLVFLRNRLKLTGTKEGCAEGDCGACTVVMGELAGSTIQFKSVNACIQWLPALDGKAIFTVEYLRQNSQQLHPAQQAMVDCHGSQCGFCTPGFVMSLWQVYNDHIKLGTPVDEKSLRSALSGNLCRCTGYKPIIEAGLKMLDLPEVRIDEDSLVKQLKSIATDQSLSYEFQGETFHAPRSLSELTLLRKKQPNATILAGCTDVGLWVNKQYQEITDIVSIGETEDLQVIKTTESGLHIGAGVSLTNAYGALLSLYPEIAEMHERFASLPIRNAGTLGGNIANGSPIGDSMPWLIAVGASVVLASYGQQRTLSLEDFYIDYMKTALRDDEVVMAIVVPRPHENQVFRTYKVSKRYDSDISAVCAAFSLQLNDDGVITDAIVAFGGMAAIPRRAPLCEQALLHEQWAMTTLKSAQTALLDDYQPLSDMRASALNRQQVATNLLHRFYLETSNELSGQDIVLSVHELSP